MKRARCDGAIVHAGELVVGLAPGSPPIGKGLTLERYDDGAVAWLDGEVVDAGPTDEVLAEWEPDEIEDAEGRLVSAGLVDAHTHLVWGGDRAGEFTQRVSGASYEDIAKRGGGILATVGATRAASDDALFDRACTTARRMLACGTTTIEAKSGYDLTRDGELRLLAIAHRVGRATWLGVHGTALAAHVLAPEYAGRRNGYLDEVRAGVALEAHDLGHARFVDLFVEQGAFTPADARRLAKAVAPARMGLRLHVDQLRDGGGAALAAELGARSADHLDHANERGLKALADAGTTAVLTPGATLTLGGPAPNLAGLRKHHVWTAIATDFNPGTSTVDSLVLCLALACRLYRMTPDEAFVGATESAARSLGLLGRIGCLRPGADADIVLWDAPDARTLSYHFGPTWARAVFRRGRRVFGAPPPPDAESWGGAT
ncbi:MAG: imidazolonepropionase [Candidatus Eisenbacteria bacterium]